MAFRKNAGNQILFILTKTGDNSHAKGATVSQITAAGPSYLLVNNGSAAVATKGTISRAASLVKSGVFRQSLKAAECNGDQGMYMFTATSCTLQFIPVVFDKYPTSMVYSQAAKAASQAVKAYSRALLTASLASDTWSLVSDVHSQTVQIKSAARSAVTSAKQAYSRALLTASLASNTWKPRFRRA